MARYPIKQLQDKNRVPFFPFNTLESVLVDGTNKNLADILNDIYTKEEINAIIAQGLSEFDIYTSTSELPEEAREGHVAVVITNNAYIMYVFYEDSWHTLTQKGDKGDPGDTGPQGPQGPQGIQGPAGADGQDGTDGTDGQDGQDGQDGFSPIANVSKSGDTATITITDKNGTTTASISDGTDGRDGADGKDGKDGYSPTATVSKSGKIATITITDKDGTTTAEIRDGEDGQGSGDMLKSTYDTDNNGIVDNAEKVNNHTVLTDVPSNAVFTDTTYTAGTGISISAENVISNTQTSAKWGNITGTLSDQTDLNTALGNKQDVIQYSTMPTASSTTVGKIVQYTGTTDSTYTNGYFYIGTTDGQSTPTYSWEQINVQPSSGGGGGTWGSITGTLSNQTDLQNALNNKQATLISGTNIKTINNTSLLGSGNITISGGAVDSSCSTTSTNAIQNKAITTYVNTRLGGAINTGLNVFVKNPDSSHTITLKYTGSLQNTALLIFGVNKLSLITVDSGVASVLNLATTNTLSAACDNTTHKLTISGFADRKSTIILAIDKYTV